MSEPTATNLMDEFKNKFLNNLEPSNEASKNVLQLITDILVHSEPEELIDECRMLLPAPDFPNCDVKIAFALNKLIRTKKIVVYMTSQEEMELPINMRLMKMLFPQEFADYCRV